MNRMNFRSTANNNVFTGQRMYTVVASLGFGCITKEAESVGGFSVRKRREAT